MITAETTAHVIRTGWKTGEQTNPNKENADQQNTDTDIERTSYTEVEQT